MNDTEAQTQRGPNWPSGETTDAAEWAHALVETAEKVAQREGVTFADVIGDPEPGGFLHGWLCSAIETARSFGASQEARTGNYAAGMQAALGVDWRRKVSS